ncbi:hypothetical protein [Priestia megaterium]|uniref:hypothetical protein n=1 Tax=Priestia megaterium TaxID=1404 RepID=UPI001DFFF50A|nr:hypothetical protein [Priestia megaterium]CAH0303974.1 hypothetical protein SRABI82_04655 [Priestia megaterium]
MKNYTVSDEKLSEVKEYYEILCALIHPNDNEYESDKAYHMAEAVYKTIEFLGFDPKEVIE